jgi:DNA-binding NarL/FixJ family response regulator
MLTSVGGNRETESGFTSPEESEHAPSADASHQLPYRVLLVDDDGRTRQLVREILENYTDVTIVGHAADGREAVALAIKHKPDVILMDIALPYLDGIEATHCIKSMCPRTVVVCLTGDFSPTKYSAMRTAGAAAFVCKSQVLAIHDMIMYALGKWTEL